MIYILQIIRTIFDNLGTKQLLEVSSVNKLWNYEARCVLRDRRKCVAVIDGDHPCLRAKKLNGMLGSLNVNFYNGLYIVIGRHISGVSLNRKSVEDVYGNLVTWPWKYLEVKWGMYLKQDCLLGQLILRLMCRSLTLEQLCIKDIPRGVELKAKNREQGELELPKLKILQLPDGSFHFPREDLLPGVLARAPNVEELRNIVEPDWMPLISVEKLKIVKKLRIPYMYGDAYTDNEAIRLLDIFCASEPKLSTLIAHKPLFRTGGNNNIRRMREYLDRLTSIIYSSAGTLREVKMESASMYKLGCILREKLVPPVLKTVECLTFEISEGPDFDIAHYLLKTPLAQIFPNVMTVTFTAKYPNYFSNEVEEVLFAEDEMFPFCDVTEVKFDDLRVDDQTVTELGALFPKLCFLEITWNQGSESYIPFRQIWSSLPFMEKFTIHGKLETRLKTNFDGEFCGIYPEEATLLQGENDEFLEAVHIVPPFSPITHMKGKGENI